MTAEIDNLIETRPHLREPLEFYARWQQFHEEAALHLPAERSSISPEDSRAYPRDEVAAVFHSFTSIFGLSRQELEPLERALEAGKVDFMRLPFDNYPAISLPCDEEERNAVLFLISRPYFLALGSISPQNGNRWKEGRCPLCSARPALSSISGGPQRLLHCSYCCTAGPYNYLGCPNCGNGDTSKLGTLASEDEPGYRIATCDECRSYVKVVDGAILKDLTTDLADMTSLPFDIVAQKKGYERSAPNPIGLKKME